MTADAKVGLLLGLVFIVMIAFLINGLPGFLQTASAEDVLDTAIKMPPTQELVIDQRIVKTARGLQEREVPLRKTAPPQEVVVFGDPSESTSVVTVQPQPQVVIQIPDIPVQTTISQPIITKPRVHVVQSGENLAVIAQKYYGKEEGNRRAVVHKLYEWNALVLDSQDKVCVGDKLTIPSLEQLNTGVSPAKVGTDSEASFLDKFSNFFERTTESSSARTYVVQQGDSLWGIAQKTLGDGKRYKEIIKYNRGIKDADDLIAGMNLKLPRE